MRKLHSSASPTKSVHRWISPARRIEFSYRFEATRMLGPHNRVCLTTPNTRFEHLAVPLVGEHQAINCGLALSDYRQAQNARDCDQ